MLLRKLGPLYLCRQSLGSGVRHLLAATLAATFLCTVACSQATKPAPATPIDVKKAELGGTPWNPQWDAVIEKDIRRRCFRCRCRTTFAACAPTSTR